MASTLGPALIGLGGVALGGAMTMVTAWWTAVSSRKGRLAELELELRHTRLLRAEEATQSALLELLYILRRLENVVNEAMLAHEHENGLPPLNRPCKLDELPDTASLREQFRDSLNKHEALLDDDLRDRLWMLDDAWAKISRKEHFDDEQYERYQVDVKRYCPVGADMDVVGTIMQSACNGLEKRLDSIILKQET
jgi:hypothetical protein